MTAHLNPPKGSDERRLVPRPPREFVTIREVAADAGVGIATVSRAINDNGYVATDVKERVLASAKRMGFRPSERARSMRTSRTMTIGAIVSDLINPVHLEFLRGVEETANANGYIVLVATSQGSPEREREILNRMVAERTDGVVATTLIGGRRSLEIMAERRITLMPPPGPISKAFIASWMAEESAATQMMGQRLIELGHRRVAIVGIQRATGARHPGYYRRARFEVLRDLLEAAGVNVGSVNVAPESPHTRTAEEIVEVAMRRGAPTAWIAGSHLVLPTLLFGLAAAGLSIPEDVSVATYGDSSWAAAYRPPLSVISHDIYREARALTAMLLASINGEPLAAEGIDYRTRYIERGSTGPAPRRRARA